MTDKVHTVQVDILQMPDLVAMTDHINKTDPDMILKEITTKVDITDLNKVVITDRKADMSLVSILINVLSTTMTEITTDLVHLGQMTEMTDKETIIKADITDLNKVVITDRRADTTIDRNKADTTDLKVATTTDRNKADTIDLKVDLIVMPDLNVRLSSC